MLLLRLWLPRWKLMRRILVTTVLVQAQQQQPAPADQVEEEEEEEEELLLALGLHEQTVEAWMVQQQVWDQRHGRLHYETLMLL